VDCTNVVVVCLLRAMCMAHKLKAMLRSVMVKIRGSGKSMRSISNIHCLRLLLRVMQTIKYVRYSVL
jgi:hypothetical protein